MGRSRFNWGPLDEADTIETLKEGINCTDTESLAKAIKAVWRQEDINDLIEHLERKG